MRTLLYSFIHRCDLASVTPDERQIDAFLSKENRMIYRERFIKFCFYFWEQRHNQKLVENILNEVS